MKQKERDQREHLKNAIEDYLGPMNNLYMLSTADLILFRAAIGSLQELNIKNLIDRRNEKK